MGQIKRLADVKRPPGVTASTDRDGTDHIFTGGQEMTEQARAARRAYKKEWNRKNKDKVKAAQARYWERRAKAAQDQQADEPEQQEA